MQKRIINIEIASIFYKMADILEIKKVMWKPAAYRAAAQTLESLKENVSKIYKEQGQKGLDNLPGIGSGIAKKIIQYVKENKIEEYEKLKKSLPAGLSEMMEIPGIGPKKASLFYNKLKIRSVEELKKAAQEHRLESLPGFKTKTEENILQGIEIKKSGNKIPLKEAEKIASSILKKLKKIPGVEKALPAGSLRRKSPAVGDIDIVVLTSRPEKVVGKFVKLDFVKKVLGKGREKVTIITKQGVQSDLRFFNRENFGSGLLYFTGSKQHNIWLRKIAIKKGLKLNEYGLFRGSKKIAGRTENEIYKALGLNFIPPEKRT
jgi:DNA polymerase (family 10)